MPSVRKSRQQTPFARKGRFGYVDDEEDEEDERSVGDSLGTPYRETDSGYGLDHLSFLDLLSLFSHALLGTSLCVLCPHIESRFCNPHVVISLNSKSSSSS
jgi:hypothetical protein